MMVMVHFAKELGSTAGTYIYGIGIVRQGFSTTNTLGEACRLL